MRGRNELTRFFSRIPVVVAVPLVLAGCAMWENMMGRRVELSGENQVPPVETTASGTARVSIDDDCSASGSIDVSDMNPTAAHIHTGGPSESGPIAVGFDKVSDTTFELPEGATLGPTECRAYKAGRTYVNVHSAQYPGGEIRGQLTP